MIAALSIWAGKLSGSVQSPNLLRAGCLVMLPTRLLSVLLRGPSRGIRSKLGDPVAPSRYITTWFDKTHDWGCKSTSRLAKGMRCEKEVEKVLGFITMPSLLLSSSQPWVVCARYLISMGTREWMSEMQQRLFRTHYLRKKTRGRRKQKERRIMTTPSTARAK